MGTAQTSHQGDKRDLPIGNKQLVRGSHSEISLLFRARSPGPAKGPLSPPPFPLFVFLPRIFLVGLCFSVVVFSPFWSNGWAHGGFFARYGMAKGSESGRSGHDIDGPEMMRFGAAATRNFSNSRRFRGVRVSVCVCEPLAQNPGEVKVISKASIYVCWETVYVFAYCGVVGNPHLTAKT